MSGGQRVDIFANEVDPARPIYSHFYWTTPTATVDNAPISQLVASPAAREHDRLPPGPLDGAAQPDRSTLGVRWDRQEIVDRFGDRRIDLKDDYAPRLGLHLGSRRRTARSQGLRLVRPLLRADPDGPRDPLVLAQSARRASSTTARSALRPIRRPRPTSSADSAILGGFTEPADPNLENQYIDEYLARLRARGAARPGGRRQGDLPRVRPGDRGLPLHRRRHLLHRQPGRRAS